MSLRVVVLADTHMRAGRPRRLPAAVDELLAGADVILHAGDLTDGSVLDTLSSRAPTHAVLGNSRSQPHRTAGILDLAAGQIRQHHIVVD